MPTLDRDGHEGLGWQIATADGSWFGTGPVLLELEPFRAAGGRNALAGVVLDTTTPHDVLDEVAPTAAASAIRFPVFRDGRGFTLVRRLRERLQFAGPVIVLGHVLPDQWTYLRRLGASVVQLEAGTDLRPWREAGSSAGDWYRDRLSSSRPYAPGGAA